MPRAKVYLLDAAETQRATLVCTPGGQKVIVSYAMYPPQEQFEEHMEDFVNDNQDEFEPGKVIVASMHVDDIVDVNPETAPFRLIAGVFSMTHPKRLPPKRTKDGFFKVHGEIRRRDRLVWERIEGEENARARHDEICESLATGETLIKVVDERPILVPA